MVNAAVAVVAAAAVVLFPVGRHLGAPQRAPSPPLQSPSRRIIQLPSLLAGRCLCLRGPPPHGSSQPPGVECCHPPSLA